MEKPLVSIIVPFYNTAEYIDECIQSVLSQLYRNIELVLVNDGSTDSSPKICQKYVLLPNVIYINLPHTGVTNARKKGVEAACGEWIIFVDSDDILLEHAVESMIGCSQNTDIVVGRQQGSKELLKVPDICDWREYLYRLFSNNGISGAPWAKLIRRQLILDSPLAFEYNVVRTQDYLMNLGIAVTNRKDVRMCKDEVYVHRMRPSSTIHTVLYSFDYLTDLCHIADSIVDGTLTQEEIIRGRIDKHMYFYNMIIPENGYVGCKSHPFVKGIKRCMNEAGVWRPMDRWLLSVSSPWAVKSVWNLRRVGVRLAHPAMIWRDVRKVSKLLNAALPYMTNCGKIIYFISQRRISWSAMKYSAFSEETRE